MLLSSITIKDTVQVRTTACNNSQYVVKELIEEKERENTWKDAQENKNNEALKSKWAGFADRSEQQCKKLPALKSRMEEKPIGFVKNVTDDFWESSGDWMRL